MSDRLTLPETGQVDVDGVPVMAASIWQREPLGRDRPEGLYAELTIGDEQGVDVAEGDEVTIAGARWRLEEVVEDPANRRGRVVITRVR